MNNPKIVSILALILSIISMILGIYVATYYIDHLYIRGISVFTFTMTSAFVARTTRLVCKGENNNSK